MFIGSSQKPLLTTTKTSNTKKGAKRDACLSIIQTLFSELRKELGHTDPSPLYGQKQSFRSSAKPEFKQEIKSEFFPQPFSNKEPFGSDPNYLYEPDPFGSTHRKTKLTSLTQKSNRSLTPIQSSLPFTNNRSRILRVFISLSIVQTLKKISKRWPVNSFAMQSMRKVIFLFKESDNPDPFQMSLLPNINSTSFKTFKGQDSILAFFNFQRPAVHEDRIKYLLSENNTIFLNCPKGSAGSLYDLATQISL